MSLSGRRKAKLSLLIVEDEGTQRELLLSIVQSAFAALTVQGASDAREAIERFDRRPFDLLLMDMDLGQGPDGLMLLSILRERSHPFKAIGLSAYSERFAFRAGKTGLDVFLTKPISREKLFAAIREQLLALKSSVDPAKRRIAFCVMPFDPEFYDRYKFGIKMAAERTGFEIKRVDEMIFTNDVLVQIQKSIKNCAVVIADISRNNANVAYEVGYAHALRKPVILLNDSQEDALFDLRNMRHIRYDGKIYKLLEELEAALKELAAKA